MNAGSHTSNKPERTTVVTVRWSEALSRDLVAELSRMIAAQVSGIPTVEEVRIQVVKR